MTGFTYLTFFLRTFYICISHSHGTLTQRKKRCLILHNKDVFARLACDFLVFEEQRFRPQTWRKHFFASGLVGCWSANSRTYVGYFCSFLNSADYLPHHRPRVYVTGINQWRRCRRILSVPQLPFRQSLHISCFLHPGGSLSKLCFVVWQVTIIRNESWSSIAL